MTAKFLSNFIIKVVLVTLVSNYNYDIRFLLVSFGFPYFAAFLYSVFLKYVIYTTFSDLTEFRKCSGVSIVDFAQVNTGWKRGFKHLTPL